MADEKDLLSTFYHEEGSSRNMADRGRDPLTGLVRMHTFLGLMQKMRAEEADA